MLLALPVIFLVAVLLAGQLNRGIYRLAFAPRAIGPWSAAHESAPTRTWLDRVPVIGWLGMRREASLHGDGFWIRPMLIELLVGFGFAALFWAEWNGHLLPTSLAGYVGTIDYELGCQYFAHVVLISLMIVATFIDFDEQTIPDSITVPGTLFALVLLWSLPACALIVPVPQTGGPDTVGFLQFASPKPLPGWIHENIGLAVGLAVLWIWCFAILDRRWITRYGFQRAVGFFVYGVYRNKYWKVVAVIAAVGTAGIVAAWMHGGPRWASLLTSLIGLAGGGGIVWSIRIVGKAALNKEAMGFGDVTLMAMIGAFLGWQPAVLAFFLAPFAGVIIAVLQAIIARESRLPYGPYLCLASLGVMLGWGRLWPEWAIDIFALGPVLAALFFGLLVLMYAMLLAMRFVKFALGIG